jgi:hypothetical protein
LDHPFSGVPARSPRYDSPFGYFSGMRSLRRLTL